MVAMVFPSYGPTDSNENELYMLAGMILRITECSAAEEMKGFSLIIRWEALNLEPSIIIIIIIVIVIFSLFSLLTFTQKFMKVYKTKEILFTIFLPFLWFLWLDSLHIITSAHFQLLQPEHIWPVVDNWSGRPCHEYWETVQISKCASTFNWSSFR